jgi:hypothetical protein
MGDIADMMLEGVLCQCCGVYIGEGNGWPAFCSACDREPRSDSVEKFSERTGRKGAGCGKCSRRFVSKAARDQHYRDKHND